ncbi:MAG: DUF177 domain-containing protein [Bacteroidales bacterium]|nr:DUF177 domain-containing protein [Bacteroidales bacterium]
MGKYSQYKIDLKNLPNETTTYSYVLDQKFFDTIDHEEVRKGNVKAELSVRRTVDAYEFNFHLFGTIQIPCDRCLDEMSQEIDATDRLVVKLGEEYSEDSDELVTIPQDEAAINIAWYLYEFIVLDIPIKHVHEQGKCNKAMVSKYRQHQAVSISDGDDEDDDEDNLLDDSLNDDDSIDDSSEENTDPRWDELKKLKK